MPASTLVLSRFSTMQKFPASVTFSSLTIDGEILVDHLTDARLCVQLGEVCNDIKSLTINFGGCGARTTEEVLDAMFDFLDSLSELRRLEIRNFVLNDPNTRPHHPPSLRGSQLSVRKLTIANTQSTSLAYLMDCISADETCLESCVWIEDLPTCSRLELVGIEPFEGLNEMLLEWDGDELTLDSCPFLDEEFIYEVIQSMTATDKPVWASVHLRFEGYPYAIRRRLDELLDVRSRL